MDKKPNIHLISNIYPLNSNEFDIQIRGKNGVKQLLKKKVPSIGNIHDRRVYESHLHFLTEEQKRALDDIGCSKLNGVNPFGYIVKKGKKVEVNRCSYKKTCNVYLKGKCY